LFFNCTVAVGTGVPSGNVTLIFRLTIAGGSGTVIVTVPVSPTITVTEAACNVAPDESAPDGLAAGAPATVVVVDVVVGGPLVHVGGQTEIEDTDNVNVTGPEVTVVRAAPVSSVVNVLDALLINVPGASGAFHRTETPESTCPLSVFTVRATDERSLRDPETTDIGTKFALSVAPFILVAYVNDDSVEALNAPTGVTTFWLSGHPVQLKIQLSAERIPEGS
jgi:hypothetical protein